MASSKPAPRSPSRATTQWTAERVDGLEREELQQLRANALALGEPRVAELCDTALARRPKNRRVAPGQSPTRRKLVSRGKAFEARGVYLQDPRASWGGVRKSDGVVVMTLWAGAVTSLKGGCACLLWAPNLEGSRPWSDSAPGRERLGHCQTALQMGAAEGLLVYGERLEGYAPEEKARSVYGVDVEALVRFTVEKRGEEYWAVWGKARDS